MERPQLFLFHFAGGSCYSFQFMTSLFNDFEIIPLELPGRGKRINENLLKDFDLAAVDLYNQIINKRNRCRFIIYGHSMGAYLALKVTHMLEKIDEFPVYLFVSGTAGPGFDTNKKWHLLEDKSFISQLIELGGMPPDFLKHTELIDYYLPILRADFEIMEKISLNDYIVKVPIYAMMGNMEENTDEISNWRNFTTSGLDSKIFEGGHFFIHMHPQIIVMLIQNAMTGHAYYDIQKSGQ